MKLFVTILTTVFSLATAAQAQTTKVELYADAGHISCALTDQGVALRTVYVFVTGTGSVSGIRFQAPLPACWLGATWVGDIPAAPGAGIGNSQSDWSLAFGICKPLPALAGQINYFATGASLPCCEIKAMQPAGGFPLAFTNCTFAEYPLAVGQSVYVNVNASCLCSGPVATESSTWGRVKSLYR